VICVICSFPFCFNLCVHCSQADYWSQFIYYASFIIIFQFGWACSQIAHLAMINELTHVDGERVQLNSFRYAWTVISNIFVYACTWLLLGMNTNGAQTNNITREDAPVFRNLTYIVLGFGLSCSIFFHIASRERPREANWELSRSLSSTQSLVVKMSWKDFLKERQFYQVTFIWMCTRVVLNTSQVYLPLYIIDTIATLSR
ncbi:unnamed protein product, partial [Didymodactylos carnosus]